MEFNAFIYSLRMNGPCFGRLRPLCSVPRRCESEAVNMFRHRTINRPGFLIHRYEASAVICTHPRRGPSPPSAGVSSDRASTPLAVSVYRPFRLADGLQNCYFSLAFQYNEPHQDIKLRRLSRLISNL